MGYMVDPIVMLGEILLKKEMDRISPVFPSSKGPKSSNTIEAQLKVLVAIPKNLF